MWRRSLLVAALVVLAGCGGLPSMTGDADTPTLTPAPVPTDGPVAVDGVLRDRLDAPGILDRHRRTLANASYTAIETVRVRIGNDTLHERRSVMRVGAGGAPFRVDTTIQGSVRPTRTRSVDVWWDGASGVERRSWADGDAVHVRIDEEPTVPLAIHGRFEGVLAAVSVASIETRPDAAIITGSIEDPSVVPRPEGLAFPENVTTTMRIEHTGVLRRMAIGYDVPGFDDSYRVRYTYQVTGIGSTEVQPPSWLGEYESSRGR